jgi:hypothetical protein
MFSWITLLFLAGQVHAQTITFASLLDEMLDRERLARLPAPPYTCRQASSYDRGTVAPDKPGWFANMDRSHFVRTEEKNGRKEYVLMDEAGPGAVVRFWATWHGPRGEKFSNGTLRFYLDKNPEPVIEGPIASIIDGGALCTGPLSKGVSPQTEPARRGHNLYLPIPYARHCKVTYETDVLVDTGAYKGEALYYQINFRTYHDGVSVTSFDMSQLDLHKEKLAAAQQRLLQSGLLSSDQLKTVGFDGPLAAGKTRTLVFDRPGAIRQLTVNLSAESLPQALRSTVLSIEFDGLASVWCPVGAFFGRGYQSDPHRTWYTEVTQEGRMSCYWVMPFQKECRISLINLSGEPVNVAEGNVKLGAWQWDDLSMYFHASWRQLTEVPSFREGTTRPGEGAFDVNYIEVSGQGVYVGDTLTIFNGTDAWWGEGDEKIYVDGESFPSHVGTGTEDYYGYAWCRPEFFQSPFHAQPTGAGNLRAGYSVNSRYRALDAIPFTSSIKFDMELWHWRNTIVNYAPAALWYARPGATDNARPDPQTAAKPVALKRSDVVEVFVVKGALEGEDLKRIEMTGGEIENQMVSEFRWSNDTQLWWKNGNVGDRLVLEFPVPRAGRYEVVANLTKAVDYAVVKLSVNDNTPQQFDRYNVGVAHDKLVLGTFDLPKGANRLAVEIVGAHEKAVKKYMFGLDYLLLIPKP